MHTVTKFLILLLLAALPMAGHATVCGWVTNPCLIDKNKLNKRVCNKQADFIYEITVGDTQPVERLRRDEMTGTPYMANIDKTNFTIDTLVKGKIAKARKPLYYSSSRCEAIYYPSPLLDAGKKYLVYGLYHGSSGYCNINNEKPEDKEKCKEDLKQSSNGEPVFLYFEPL